MQHVVDGGIDVVAEHRKGASENHNPHQHRLGVKSGPDLSNVPLGMVSVNDSALNTYLATHFERVDEELSVCRDQRNLILNAVKG